MPYNILSTCRDSYTNICDDLCICWYSHFCMVLRIYRKLILRILSSHGTKPILSTLRLYGKAQIQHILQHLNMLQFLCTECLSYYGCTTNIGFLSQKALRCHVSSFSFLPFHYTQYFLNILSVPCIKYKCWTRLSLNKAEFLDKAQSLDNFLLLRCFLSQSTKSQYPYQKQKYYELALWLAMIS